jgi:hypothetical protein
MAIPHDVREAKVCQLDVVLAVQKKVFRLQVPMHDHVPVAVFKP